MSIPEPAVGGQRQLVVSKDLCGASSLVTRHYESRRRPEINLIALVDLHFPHVKRQIDESVPCQDCTHLLYRTGKRSICSRASFDGSWPCDKSTDDNDCQAKRTQ